MSKHDHNLRSQPTFSTESENNERELEHDQDQQVVEGDLRLETQPPIPQERVEQESPKLDDKLDESARLALERSNIEQERLNLQRERDRLDRERELEHIKWERERLE